jgi:hypothetical protein
MIKMRKCHIHGKTKHFKRNETKNSYRCSQCSLDTQARRKHKIKAMIVEIKGGKCSLCGYSKHLGSLQFHHLDPSKKDFRLGKMGSHSLDKILKEVDKCVLLCSNCHQEVHDGAATLID